MNAPANALRGEASLLVEGMDVILRPSFAALIAAEEELGPLFALVERAGTGQLRLAEMAALFWHCAGAQDGLTRSVIENAVMKTGLASCAKPLRILLGQVLQGQP